MEGGAPHVEQRFAAIPDNCSGALAAFVLELVQHALCITAVLRSHLIDPFGATHSSRVPDRRHRSMGSFWSAPFTDV